MVESSVEASMVFEKLFSDYLRSQNEPGDSALLERRMEFLKKDFPIMNEVETGESGEVSINLGRNDIGSKIEMLASAFDMLVDVMSYTKGSERAYKEAEGVVMNVKRQFEDQFTNLNLEDHLLKGALSGKLRTGTPGMDEILGGGIPSGHMVLVFGPPGKEKHQFIFQFLTEGLRVGGGGLAIVASISVDELRSRVRKLGVDVSACESKGTLKIIDWYTQKGRAIVGMEEHGSVFIPSKDIANLDIATGTAISKLTFTPTKRAAVDFITQALNVYELSSVIEFIQREKRRLKKEGFTALFLVEQGAHDERVISTLKHLSDGVVNIVRDQDNNLFIEVESMTDSRFKSGRYALQMSARGLTVVGETVDELDVISEFTRIDKVDVAIARKLVDTGFTDLDALYNASEEELLKVEGVTSEMARSIKAYTGTVEFSQRMLAKRSEGWLRRGREQIQSGDIGKARKSVERALEIDPNNVTAVLELSRLAQLEGNMALSEEYYRKAVEMDPDIARRWGGDPDIRDGNGEAG